MSLDFYLYIYLQEILLSSDIPLKLLELYVGNL